MDLQQFIDLQVKNARKMSFEKSNQLTLGQLIEKIESITNNDCDGDEPYVVYDFEYLFPSSINSWRGSYSELALNFESGGSPMSISSFLSMLKETVGKTFEGYKGGDFLMGKETPIWVANYGNSGNTGVVDVLDLGYKIVIITQYCEY